MRLDRRPVLRVHGRVVFPVATFLLHHAGALPALQPSPVPRRRGVPARDRGGNPRGDRPPAAARGRALDRRDRRDRARGLALDRSQPRRAVERSGPTGVVRGTARGRPDRSGGGTTMKIFLAGGTGVIGPALVRRLIEEGHDVTAITRKPERARQLEELGAEPVVGDVLEADELIRSVERAGPEVVIQPPTHPPPHLNPTN